MNVSAFLGEAAMYEDVLLNAAWASSDCSQAVIDTSYCAEYNPAALMTSVYNMDLWNPQSLTHY